MGIIYQRSPAAHARLSPETPSINTLNNSDREGEMAKEATRKGPWIDEEDRQLIRAVELFGDRRWDFLAKISGENFNPQK